MNRLAKILVSQNHAGHWRSRALCIGGLARLSTLPARATGATWINPNTRATPRHTANFNSFDSNTFNCGLAHTHSRLATSKSQHQIWLILTNPAGTSARLTSTSLVLGSGDSHLTTVPHSRKHQEVTMTS